MQIKIVRYHLKPVRMAIINKSTNNTCWQGCGALALFVGMQTGEASICTVGAGWWKAVWAYLKKLKMGLPLDPWIPLLGIYPKELKTLMQKNISIPIFTAVLFTITKIWKQPKCPSVNKWIKQPWNIYTMEYYSAIRKEESFALCNSMDGPGEHYAE